MNVSPWRIADQLQRAVERNEYGEAAHLIEAVQQLAGHFQSFVAIPKVAELSGRVATLQRAVQVTSRANLDTRWCFCDVQMSGRRESSSNATGRCRIARCAA